MSKAIPYDKVKIIDKPTIKFGDDTFDGFLSSKGGVERGVMIALAGTSGAGKTTLCKKLQRDFSEPSLFYALESRKSSVARQTSRIKTGEKELIADVDDFPLWSQFIKNIYDTKPSLVIVDSLQHAAELLSKENGKYKYDNYKNIIKDLYDWKDLTQGVVILIVQLNAEGKVEGPAATVFDVDCPIKMIANPDTNERYMVTTKNRMGPTGKIFYSFTSDDRHIEFFTPDEWALINTNLSLPSFISDSIQRYLIGVSKNRNYPEFKKEFSKAYKKIYDNTDDDMKICVETMMLIDNLSHILKRND
jgi:predicted ATP-dependent serine protease